MKILTILGARPQFIKAAALSREISNRSDLSEVIIHTGQHFDNNMSQIFFDELVIPKPQYNLGISGLNHGAMTGRMLEGIEEVILQESPDVVLVYGDTNSTLAGALAAKKMHLKVAHVEAGLRSFDLKMPEEINRILTDRISDYLYTPTQQGVSNLLNEGFNTFPVSIVKTGDIMYDSALFYSKKAESAKSQIVIPDDYILCTIHRAENTDNIERLRGIINALNDINTKKSVIVPLHPRTKAILDREKIKLNFKIIAPVGYIQMIQLIKNSKYIITDSGVLQKEAYFFNKKSLVLRDSTEWIELIQNSYAFLAGYDYSNIIDSFEIMIRSENNLIQGLYGDGNTSKLIIDHLMK